MKTKIFLLYGAIILLLLLSCCKDEDKKELLHAEGYIIGFNPCGIQSHMMGYVIVSTDLQDTLVTYNLADKIYKMPASVVFNMDTLYRIPISYFQNYYYSSRFPESARYEFKIKITYDFATKQEMLDIICFWNIIGFEFPDKSQVIIKSASKD